MSTGSKDRAGTSSAEAEVQRLRMEAQFLQWEKELIAKKLEAAMELQLGVSSNKGGNTGTPAGSRRGLHQVDSDVEFQLPGETSGYVSGATGKVSGAGGTPELAPKMGREVSFMESTPLRDPGLGIKPQAGSTPIALGRESQVMDDLTLFLSGQGGVEQGKSSTNPFACEGEKATPKQVHNELLSFATRPVEAKDSSSVERVDSSSVGPWPLKREARVHGDSGQKESLERLNRRPNITPDRYSGKVLWKEYFRHFESCREVNQWSEEQAAKWLAASLQGDALRLVGDSGQKHTYGELVKLLQRRFGSARQSENYLVELRHRRQKPKESLLELGQAIHELTVRAYPEIQEEAREKLAKNHFIDAVDSHSVREGINRARPKTLDEAVHAALETENFEKVEQHRLLDRKPAKFARALNSDTEQRLETLELSLREQAKTLSSVAEMMKSLSGQTTGQGPGKGASSPKTSQPGRHEPGTFKCFKCKEKGHFARECKKAPKQGNGNQPPVGPAGRLRGQEGPKENSVTVTAEEKRDQGKTMGRE